MHLRSEDDRNSNVRHEQQQAYAIVGTDPPSNSEDISNENDEKNVGFDELLSDPKIARNLHWNLFEPNELVYIKRKFGPWTKVFEEECVLVTDIRRRLPMTMATATTNPLMVCDIFR